MSLDIETPLDAGGTAPMTPRGLGESDVAERIRRGEVNAVPTRTSRSTREIVRANVFTRFNAILGVLLFVVVIVGPPQDALFAGVLVSNTAIGIVQEIRAKRTLDRLALLTVPHVAVIREGRRVQLPREQVVLDDVLEIAPGDQVVVDGVVVAGEGLAVDESLLSGESEPVDKQPGARVMSGTFVTEGSGFYRATQVGPAAYAVQLAEEARRFTLVRSELRSGIDRILRIVTWLLVPTAALLVTSQMLQDHGISDALRASVAGVGSMIPEGLVLLTSIAFAVGVVRLGRRRVLVQELPAIEGLARVDVVCIDKTGTLTDGTLTVAGVEVLDGGASTSAVLGALARTEPHPNATLRAVADAFPSSEPAAVDSRVAFASDRKWSGASFTELGTWVLGAPEVLLEGTDAADSVGRRVTEQANLGRRVLLLARAGARLNGPVLPPDLAPVALLILEERIRDDAADTLRYFARQGVRVMVLSGDHPATTGAVARRLEIEGGDEPFDARKLPTEPGQLEALVDSVGVFGRVTPHQKQAIVRALQASGHVVAMTGDGVNDAIALKDADIGVAMGSGAPATRGVAQLVLLDSSFAALPPVVGEGRRVIANVERVANLFLTKTVYAFLLALATGVASVPFPFYPRHLTIVSTATIGIPAFFLALAPAAARARPGFVVRVLRFAIPAGAVAAAATFGAYALVLSEDVTVGEARTVATLVLAGVGLWILTILARPLTAARIFLVGSMAAMVAGLFTVPTARDFFALDLPTAIQMLAAIGIIALAGAALDGGWHASGWVRSHSARELLGRASAALRWPRRGPPPPR